jgi:hypothetical protein
MKTTTVSEVLQTVLVKTRVHKLVFSLVQDTSGSMAGSRLQTSLAGLDYMFEEVFHPKDFLGVITYNTAVTTVHRPMAVSKVDKQRDMEAIRHSVGGRTATYDALGGLSACHQ